MWRQLRHWRTDFRGPRGRPREEGRRRNKKSQGSEHKEGLKQKQARTPETAASSGAPTKPAESGGGRQLPGPHGRLSSSQREKGPATTPLPTSLQMGQMPWGPGTLRAQRGHMGDWPSAPGGGAWNSANSKARAPHPGRGRGRSATAATPALLPRALPPTASCGPTTGAGSSSTATCRMPTSQGMSGGRRPPRWQSEKEVASAVSRLHARGTRCGVQARAPPMGRRSWQSDTCSQPARSRTEGAPPPPAPGAVASALLERSAVGAWAVGTKWTSTVLRGGQRRAGA